MPELTAKEHAFVNSYIAQGTDVVGSKAAIEAGYAAGSAAVTASRLLRKPNVAAEIARRRGRSEKKSQLTAEKIMTKLNELVDFDPADCVDDQGNLLPLKQIPEAARKALAGIDLSKGSFKSASKLGSLELAAKLIGMLREQQSTQQAVQIIISAPAREVLEVAPQTVQLLPEWE